MTDLKQDDEGQTSNDEDSGSALPSLLDPELVRGWWEEIWMGKSYDDIFDKMIGAADFIDPDTIIAPRAPRDSVGDRAPSPKVFWSRRPSDLTDIDFDYGTAIGKSAEECAAYIEDTESIFEVMAVSISNHLCSSVSPEGKVDGKRQNYKVNKFTSKGSDRSLHSQSDHETTQNTSSVQESVERNWEYYENLRKCYDPDPVMISQPIHERSKSEESTPDLKKDMKNFQSMVILDRKGKRKLIRRMTTPNLTSRPKTDGDKKIQLRQLRYSRSFFRKSLSSFDLPFAKLGSVKELDDEDLTIPFEPEEAEPPSSSPPPALKRMKSIISRRMKVDHFIRDIKKEIVFKEEAKDELHDLPSTADYAKINVRLSSPEPMDLPGEFKKMSYKELNKYSLSTTSVSTPEPLSEENVNTVPTINTPDEGQFTSISPILRVQKRPTNFRRRPVARLANPSLGYSFCVHRTLFQLRLDENLNVTEEESSSSEETESEGGIDDLLSITKRYPKRFDSTACMILPNSFCISPTVEKGFSNT